MRTVLSESKLLIAFVLLVAVISIVSNVKLFSEPVYVSELSLLLLALAFIVLVFSVLLIRSGITSNDRRMRRNSE
jgi:hypothetical protein